MAETRDEAHVRPPGSVADEAAALAELLAERGWGGSSTGAGRSESAHGGARSTSQCTCGGAPPAACRLCPVCQLIAFVQQVSPDSLEKVAEIVDLAATALRDLAQAQRDRAGEDVPRRTGAETSHGGDAP
ncbi:hypothetical protein IDVR_15440 [Intrasporangium sp. DVR]